LNRYLVDGHTEDVPVVIPPSPWPSHFTVIAVDDGFGTTRMAFWPPGRYRLDLTIEPGHIERSIEVRVEGPASTPSTPAPAPSADQVRP
jgi:hypothetical protein